MALEARDYDMLRGLFGTVPLPTVNGQIPIAATLQRNQLMVNTIAAATTGVMLLTGIHLPANVTVTSINFLTGGTGATTPTHSWTALYKSDATLIAQTTDAGSAAIAANTVFTTNLPAGVIAPYSGLYYLAIMIASSGQPTFCGVSSDLASISPVLAGTSNSGLTTTAPASASSFTGVATVPYMWVS